MDATVNILLYQNVLKKVRRKLFVTNNYISTDWIIICDKYWVFTDWYAHILDYHMTFPVNLEELEGCLFFLKILLF